LVVCLPAPVKIVFSSFSSWLKRGLPTGFLGGLADRFFFWGGRPRLRGGPSYPEAIPLRFQWFMKLGIAYPTVQGHMQKKPD